ncbi:Abi family protein [Paenarthrobacter sp. NPDC090520]|uniref:Abi family protein n=1 Tax=Paenarthrobacter sp. NPDC090520 TaxID=3364382 RepID=UPI00382A9E47
MVNSSDMRFFQANFGRARLQHYLDECQGDIGRVMHLYQWNTELSAAFRESLGHLEVALRNAIDQQMSARHLGKGRPGHWIYDDARELGRGRGKGTAKHAYPYADIDTAIKRVRKNKMPTDPGQIISEISFGFWHQMVSKGQMALWPDLAGAFPYMNGRSQRTVADKVESLRALRNRIGHHHRIWSIDVATKYAQLVALAGYISPQLASWIDDRSRVRALLARRP